MLDEGRCEACDSMFLNTALTDGRCSVCIKEGRYAGDGEQTDYIKSDKKKRDDLKALIKEVLNELKEEEVIAKNEKVFEPRKCKKCGGEFIPMTSGNLYCRECKN